MISFRDDEDVSGAQPSKYASAQETAEALEGLTDEDLAKLLRLAGLYCNSRHLRDAWGDPEDLFHAAVEKTLQHGGEGKQWRRGLSIVSHLASAMRNMSGHAAGSEQYKAQQRRDMIQPELLEEQRRAERRRSPEDQVVAAGELARLEKHLAKEVFGFVRLRGEGMTESEAAAALGLSGRQKEAVARRARRGLLAYKARTT